MQSAIESAAIKAAASDLNLQKLKEEHAAATRKAIRSFFPKLPKATIPTVSRTVSKPFVQPNPDTPPPLQRVQQAWRQIAQASARCCFNSDGQINIECAHELQRFWQNVVPTNHPFNAVPGIELVREQTLAVLEKLLIPPPPGQNPLRDQLSRTIGMQLSDQGMEILNIMRIPYNMEMRSGRCDSQAYIPLAILQSLFTPHRQMCLPTCSINALINAEIFNHPERLANIYIQILTSPSNDRISLPVSGNDILLRLIVADQPGNHCI
jgi:hypothetical protein